MVMLEYCAWCCDAGQACSFRARGERPQIVVRRTDSPLAIDMPMFCKRVVARATYVSFSILLALASAPSAHAQALPTDSAIRAILKTRVDSGVAVGIVVGILENGRRRYVSYGSAGPGRPPLDEHTIFEIGSVSKTFTALLLADAVVRGEVQLEQPVAQLLPPGTVVPSRDGRQITLEHLGTHRSGLPRMPDNFSPKELSDPYADYDAARLYAFLASYRLPRSPGDTAEYSNLGGGLLGHALAVRAGVPSWGALVERRITNPLEMRETLVDVPAPLRVHAAKGFDSMLDSVPDWHHDVLAGAGALRSTASDMLLYLGANLDTVRGPLARAAAIARVPRASFAAGVRMSLGWFVVRPATQPAWWHNGGTGGFRSFAAFDPNRGLGIVILSNTAASVDDIGMHLLNPAAPVGLPLRTPRTVVTLTGEQLDRLVGEYPLSPEFVLRVTREGEVLFLQATGQPRLRLTSLGENHCVSALANAELVFDTSEPGPARHVTLRQNGAMVTGPRRQ
jgi:CubicO group peptidase (beta-lactamase class C family)